LTASATNIVLPAGVTPCRSSWISAFRALLAAPAVGSIAVLIVFCVVRSHARPQYAGLHEQRAPPLTSAQPLRWRA